jgi:hypothetical protein
MLRSSAVRQIPVNERDRHGTFAHSRCAALDRIVPDVAGGEKAGNVGFEVIRRAVEGPAIRPRTFLQEVGAGDQIARFISHHAGL